MTSLPIALLCREDESSAAVASALQCEFGDVRILVEDREARKTFLRRRVRRLGPVAVAGQVAFAAILAPRLRRRSTTRIEQILRQHRIDTDPAALRTATRVTSVNAPEAVEWLRGVNPAVVVVNGTRIIARRVLEAVPAPFINMHCGITPEYRGSHGGYWALSRGDADRCGVTIHLVDQGIDTGGVLAQAPIHPERLDNFATYPTLQLAAGLPLLLRQVRAAIEGRLDPQVREATSGLWYHPTIWGYLATGLRRGIW